MQYTKFLGFWVFEGLHFILVLFHCDHKINLCEYYTASKAQFTEYYIIFLLCIYMYNA